MSDTNLWQRVLEQALQDATNPHIESSIRDEAVQFINASTGILLDDLEDVCAMADIKVHNFVKQSSYYINNQIRFRLRHDGD